MVWFAIVSNSYISSPIVSLGRFRISIFNTILIEPIGERKSCAITEYSLSRPMIVLRNSSVCATMIRLAATSEIWCVTRMISSSLLNGLEIKSLPPTWNPFTISAVLFSAVRKMIGISDISGSAFICFATSNPLMSGIMTSNSTRSGFSFFTCAKASVPLPTVTI